jgi:hypothetical protein
MKRCNDEALKDVTEEFEDTYKVRFEVYEHHVNYYVFIVDENKEADLRDAEISGFIKWDGCMEFSSKVHLCNIFMVNNYCNVIKYVRKRSSELLDASDFRE